MEGVLGDPGHAGQLRAITGGGKRSSFSKLSHKDFVFRPYLSCRNTGLYGFQELATRAIFLDAACSLFFWS